MLEGNCLKDVRCFTHISVHPDAFLISSQYLHSDEPCIGIRVCFGRIVAVWCENATHFYQQARAVAVSTVPNGDRAAAHSGDPPNSLQRYNRATRAGSGSTHSPLRS
jgi:hypothetical protein